MLVDTYVDVCCSFELMLTEYFIYKFCYPDNKPSHKPTHKRLIKLAHVNFLLHLAHHNVLVV